MSFGILAHRLPMILGSVYFSSHAEVRPIHAHIRFDLFRGVLLLLMAGLVYLQSIGWYFGKSSPTFVTAFLALAAVRSFLSGPDGALKAKIISISFEKKEGAHLQQRLQSILGVTGFLASLLFVVGLWHFSFWEVLVFDSLTFFLSAGFIRRIRLVSDPDTVSRFSGSGLLNGLVQAPRTWHLIYLHTLRVAAASIPLQAALILLKTRFGLGPESSGYLYALVTLAWVLSSELVLRAKLILTAQAYIWGIVLIAVLSPLLWITDSLWMIGSLTLLIWFVDGMLLSSVAGSLQRESGSHVVARVFSTMTATSNLGLVIFSVLLGFLTDRVGPLSAAIALGGVTIVLVLIGELLFKLMVRRV